MPAGSEGGTREPITEVWAIYNSSGRPLGVALTEAEAQFRVNVITEAVDYVRLPIATPERTAIVEAACAAHAAWVRNNISRRAETFSAYREALNTEQEAVLAYLAARAGEVPRG